MNATQKAQLDAILKTLPPKRTIPDNSAESLIKRLAWIRVKKSNPSLWYEEDRIKRDFYYQSQQCGHENARRMLQEKVEELEGIHFTTQELEAIA